MQFLSTPLRSSRLLEALRAFPAPLVHAFIVAHALTWALGVALVFATPPYEVMEALTLGREGAFGTPSHPPLSAWVAAIADTLGGGHLWIVNAAGVLPDCLALWAVFQLSRTLVGDRHGAFAVLLLAGVWWVAWTPPSLEPDRLLLALYPLAALHLWRAAFEGKRHYWLFVAVDIALLALAKYTAAVFLAALALALVSTPRGRASLRGVEPWGAVLVAGMIFAPHVIWLIARDNAPIAHAMSGAGDADPAARALDWATWLGLGVVGHLGLGLLVLLATLPRAAERESVPSFVRPPLDPAARRYVAALALAPALLLAAAGLAFGLRWKDEWLVPMFAFSGLFAVMRIGDTIPLYRQALVGRVLALMVLAPPLVFAMVTTAQPWGGGEGLDTNWPSGEMGRWFTDVHRTRTGKPLAIVAGEARLAGTIAVASPDRPSVMVEGDRRRSPWVSERDLARDGVLVVWRVAGTDVAPPAELARRFPGLLVEPPRSFDWATRGRLAPIRIGWGIVRATE